MKKELVLTAIIQHQVHKTPFYKLKTKLPVTDWAASNVLSIPIHPKVTKKNLDEIAKIMREVFMNALGEAIGELCKMKFCPFGREISGQSRLISCSLYSFKHRFY